MASTDPLALPTTRAVWEARLRSGHRIRFRPDLIADRWLVDLWSKAGTQILGGEPLVVSADLWAQYRARDVGFPTAALVVSGSDPTADLPLADQDLTLREV